MSKSDEKAHYDCHQNDSKDKEYQKFVSPIVNSVQKDFKSSHKGLDFGCGKDSAIIFLLRKNGYNIIGYDYYYDNNPKTITKNYDYITCSEVIEHFQNPIAEFKKLYEMLNPGGKLYCMTELFSETMNFDEWYYKNDPTHVFFYSEKTIEWISGHFGFESFSIDKRLIVFSKK